MNQPFPNKIGSTHTQDKSTKSRFLQRWHEYWQMLFLMDSWILGTVLILLIISCFLIFSASFNSSPLTVLFKQLMAIIVGILMGVCLMFFPQKIYRSVFWQNVALTLLVILIFYATYFGHEAGGASSWIDLGFFNLQPSELLKIMTLLLLARLSVEFKRTYLLKYEKSVFWRGYYSLLLWALSIFLITRQPDYGTALIIFLVFIGVLAIYHAPYKKNIKWALGFLGFYLFAYWFFDHFSDQMIQLNGHIFQRLGSFTNPFRYQLEDGFQVVKSYQAFANGGLFGKGLGQGTVKLVLPAAHTDFILAVAAEEFGFVGVSVITGLLFFLMAYLLRLSATLTIRFNRVFVSGVALLIFIQSMINIGGLTGLIPLTGVTLPFISSGGTSIITNLLLIALVQKFYVEERYQRLKARQGDNRFYIGGIKRDL